jgi:HEAT repeat protein
MDAAEIVAWLHDEREHDLEDVLASLRAQRPREAERVLRRLAAHRDPVVRAWAAWAIGQALPSRASALLERLLDDRDPDVRGVALEEVRRLGLASVERHLPRLVAKLRSRDFFEPVSALWTVAELRAEDARAEVERIVERPAEPFHARIAEIVLAVLDGDDRAVAARLRGHEHEATAWLANAARLLGTPAARDALEEIARSAPDEECRRFCGEALARWPPS